MDRDWTIRSTLVWIASDFASRNIANPRLDAELLVSRALDCDRVGLYMDLEKPLQATELARIRELVIRRRQFEPMAYILGEREFYGRLFTVTRDVLIPRPDTEVLVEKALDIIGSNSVSRCLDLCTGSGAIAITLVAEKTDLFLDATDISPDAIKIAVQNAEKHGTRDRIRFFQGDLFDALPNEDSSGGYQNSCQMEPYGMIVCNPPYIAQSIWDDLAPDINRFEPKISLLGGEDGLDFYRRLCQPAARWLYPQGILLLEVGKDQADSVVNLLESVGEFVEIKTYKDLANIERVIQARRK